MRPNLFKLEAIFEKYEHVKGMNVLGASDAETFKVGELRRMDGGKLDLDEIDLGYGDVKGLDELRRVVARSYVKAKISKNNVLITVGASEAIVLALHALLKPGDKALVCSPAYQSLYEMAAVTGAQVIEYEYREEKGFIPNLDKVRKELRQKPAPRVLVLNTPHNPTGQVLAEKKLKGLLGLAKSTGTTVVVDEVFSGIRIGNTRLSPSAACLDRGAIVIGSLSKVYGLAGLRIGWLVGPPDFIKKCKELRYYTSLSPPSIVQQLGKIAIVNKATILARTQRNVTENYNFALDWLQRHQDFLGWIPPQAGLVMLLRLRKVKDRANTAQFVRQLAEQFKVFLVPCEEAFGLPEGYLRLGLGSDPKKFRKGLEVIGHYLRSGRRWD